MATSTSFNSSTNDQQSTSTSTPVVTQTPQSTWSLALSQALAALGSSNYAWAMGEYAKAGAITDAQINNFIQNAQQASNFGQGLMDRYNNIYGPQADQYALNSGSYDSLGRIQNEMGAAESRAMQAGKQASDNAERQLQAFGIDPSSGRYQDLIRASRTADAASAASAGETARRAVEQEGDRRREFAIQEGDKLPAAGLSALNSAYTGIQGAEAAALGLANTGATLTGNAAKFFDPATHLTNPLQGQNQQSQSTGTGRSLGGSNSNSPPGGGGGGGSRTSDPFNSDRFGRPSNAPPLNSPHGGPPNGPQQNFTNPLTRTINGQGGMQELDYGQQSPYNPSDPFNGLDPYSQAGGGVLQENNYGQGWPEYDPNQWGGQQYYDPNQGQWGSDWTQGTTYGGDLTTPPANWGGDAWSGPTYGDYPTQQSGGGYDPNAGGFDNSGGGDSFSGYDPGYTTPDANWGDGGSAYTGGSDYSGYDDYSSYGESYARGGPVRGGKPQPQQRPQQRPQGGGMIPTSMSPSRGRVTDDIPAVIPQTGGQARINAGEFVIPREVVAYKGQEFFQKLIAQARKTRVSGGQQRG